jgi:hypothetical protein
MAARATGTSCKAAWAVGLGAAVVLATGVAQAGAGGSLMLGARNTAHEPTTLVNRGTGPALRLESGDDAPSLSVSNRKRVTNLNADFLDGLTSRKLQRRVDGTCAAGQMLLGVKPDGSVYCGVDNVDGGTAAAVAGAGVIRSVLEPSIPSEAVLWQDGEVRLRVSCAVQQTNDDAFRVWVDNDSDQPVYVGWNRDPVTGAVDPHWATVAPGEQQTLVDRTGGGQSAPVGDMLGTGTTFSVADAGFDYGVSGDLGYSLGLAEPVDACIVLARLDVP